MNHRSLVASIDIDRSLLHRSYQYNNWNLAAVKGMCDLPGDSALLYGNIGVWLTNDDFSQFTDYNQGFPKGIDQRKISKIIRSNQQIYAGTYFGLYRLHSDQQQWVKELLPGSEERITDLLEKDSLLYVQTRSFLWRQNKQGKFEQVALPAPEGYEKKVSLFKTLWLLHSGELFGIAGKLLVDLLGLVVILLSVTGLLHFLFPKLLKQRKKKGLASPVLKKTMKTNLQWHNQPGFLFVAFLVITTITGMFLRPPLLIPIAHTKVSPIPRTMLDSHNPWFDQLRRVMWDEERRIWVFATSEGIFFANDSLSELMYQPAMQPPVSVMGCNVLEKKQGNYLIGSFSGLFLWNPFQGTLIDYTTGLPYQPPVQSGPPVSKDMVDGYLMNEKGMEILFDYQKGAVALGGSPGFTAMPGHVKQQSPVSLWNLALEIHTGRIFEPYLGAFYILYVPLAGLCILMVLISGFFIWWKNYRRKASQVFGQQ